jgi:hypothetical protein
MRSFGNTRRTTGLLALAFLLGISTWASASTISPIGPFTGTISEGFESFSLGDQNASLAIFGAHATASDGDFYIYNTTTRAFGIGIPAIDAQVADGNRGLGLNGSEETARITFAAPVTDFGGFWGSGSPSNGITFSFFDAANNLLGTVTTPYHRNGAFEGGDGGLDWHGWTSTTPITSITFSGDFVVADKLEAIPTVPEPATLVLVGGALALSARSLRRKRTI